MGKLNNALPHEGTILIYTIHGVETWFKYLGDQMGYERAITFSDIRGDGDLNIVDDFYAAYRRARRADALTSELLDESAIREIIARCRTLRWLPHEKAAAMAVAMAEVIDTLIARVNPQAVLSFPIDRYIMDILSRRAKARGIPYFEYTAAPFAKMSMLLYEGQLLRRTIDPDTEDIENKRAELVDPLFKPSYVSKAVHYGKSKFLKIFAYFKLRGRFFQAISWLKRDPLGLHYLDAQSFLGHKPRIGDIAYDSLVDNDWEEAVAGVPASDRLAMPLALFPEASIDYWVHDLGLVDYENMLIDIARSFSDAGFMVLVKDHPLQFGFRQLGLIRRLKAIPNVLFLPYEVSGNKLMDVVENCFVLTGTLGLQAALLGKTAIVADSYYSNARDFILLGNRQDIASLPHKLRAFSHNDELHRVQTRIVGELLKGCFDGDYETWRGFDPNNPSPEVTMLGRNIGLQVAELMNEHPVAD
ncbi:MAG: hypothetical protein P8J20_08885 [Novosphingobium sp.]|nr:hypothetical protein [Novosphingobium sp.]